MDIRDKIKQFFKDRPHLSINGINSKCDIPKGQLNQFLHDRKRLTDDQISSLLKELKKYEFNVDEYFK